MVDPKQCSQPSEGSTGPGGGLLGDLDWTETLLAVYPGSGIPGRLSLARAVGP